MTVGLLSFAAIQAALKGSTINVPTSSIFMNLMKNAGSLSAGTSAWPGLLNSDGYPAGADLTSTLSGNFATSPSYYGHYIWKWTGTGSFQFTPQTIIYGTNASGVVNGVAGTSGSVAFNCAILNKTTPRVELAFGAIITGIADNGSGLIRLTASLGSAFINTATGNSYTVNNVTNLASQAWTITKIDNNNIDLQGSTYNGTMAVVGGSPGTASEAILSLSQVSFQFLSGSTTTWSMSNHVFCKLADETSINSGNQIRSDLVAIVQAMKPKYLRMMDLSSVINSTATNFTYRSQPTQFAYGPIWVPSYWVGAITNGGSDAYTCANPSASGGGAYVDGEIVQGQIAASSVNVGTSPTLNVNSRGAKPILDASCSPQRMTLTGTTTTGNVINIVFTGSYIAGSPFTFSYTVLSSDTSIDTLGASLTAAMNANATLIAANITATNAGSGNCGLVYNRNGQGVAPRVATTFSYTQGANTTAITFGTVAAATIVNNGLTGFTYNAILDCWITATSGGLLVGTPIEVMCELCNRSNIGLWLPLPLLYSGASVTAAAAKVRDTLNSNLSAVFELSNEIWNFGEFSTSQAQNIGASLGFTFGSVRGISGFYGLRVAQFMPLIVAAWISTRSRASLICMMADFISFAAQGLGFTSQLYRYNGGDLVTTNLTYNGLAGLGGTAGANLNSFPNRPMDQCDALAYAPYWQGALAGNLATSWFGTQSFYNTLFQASLDYFNGLTAQALTAWDNDVRTGTRNGVAGSTTLATIKTQIAAIETILATYDSQRAGGGLSRLGVYAYEGGEQQGLGSSFSGTNTPNPDSSVLSAQFTSNSWTLNPTYGASNAVVAANMVTLFIAYKNSATYQATVTQQYQDMVNAHTLNVARTVYPAWYGFVGPSAWGIYPGDITTTPYKTYDAIVAWDN